MDSREAGDARRIAKEDQWLAQHEELVASGDFDTLPIPQIAVGDIVAVRMNGLIHQVYELGDEDAVVGYDLDGKSVRETVSYADIRGAGEYQTALLKFMGKPGGYRIEVEGREARLIDEASEKADLN